MVCNSRKSLSVSSKENLFPRRSTKDRCRLLHGRVRRPHLTGWKKRGGGKAEGIKDTF
jgi:hypothetical protein